MKVVITYIEATGEVTRMVSNVELLDAETYHVSTLTPPQVVFVEELESIEDFNCSDWFVEDNQIQRKTLYPEVTVNNGLITDLPIDTTVLWPDGVETIESDGSIELESNVSGEFNFVLSHVLYFPKDLVVNYSV